MDDVLNDDKLLFNVERKPISAEPHDENGTKLWGDGSKYEGLIVDAARHGFGFQTWADGESYRGQFYNDFFHGFGLYKWTNGSFYLGTFYMDHREGYGIQYKNNTCYEGLFGDNVEMGVGRLIYFDSESMDVGFWKGNKLIKIFKCISDFLILEVPPFLHNNDFKKAFISQDDLKLQCNIFNEELLKKCNEIAASEEELFVNFLPKSSLSLNRKLFNEAFDKSADMSHGFFLDVINDDIKNILYKISKLQPVSDDTEIHKKIALESNFTEPLFQVWNETPSSLALQKHILRYQHLRQRISFDVDLVLFKHHLTYKRGQQEKISEEYFNCCLQGKVIKVKKMIKNKRIYVDVCDENGNSPLMGAAMNSHLEVVNILLNSGADVNRLNDFGMTALLATCLKHYKSRGSLDKAQMLYQFFSQPLQPESPIRDDSLSSDLSKSNRFIDTSGNINDINCELGKLNLKRQKDFNALELIWRGTSNVTENTAPILTTFSEHSDQKTSKESGSCEDKVFHSIVELLLRRGANPNASHWACSPLHLAIISEDVKATNLLLERGSDCESSLHLKGGIEVKPLHCACMLPGNKALEMVKLLLASGADINSTSSSNEALNTDEGIEPEQKPPYKIIRRTSLELVCLRDDDQSTSQIFQTLIDHKADLNIILESGLSPLALCLSKKKYELAKHMLKNGADPNLPMTGSFQNALCVTVATENDPANQRAIIDMLVQHGADVTLPLQGDDGKVTGNFIDHVHHLQREEALTSKSNLSYHEMAKVKKSNQMLLDYLSQEAKRKITSVCQQKSGGIGHEHGNSTPGDSKSLGQFCHECGRSSVRLNPCPRCGTATYCGKFCMNKSWRGGHKYQCSSSGAPKSGHSFQNSNNIQRFFEDRHDAGEDLYSDFNFNESSNSSPQNLTFGKTSTISSMLKKIGSKHNHRKDLKFLAEQKQIKVKSGNLKTPHRRAKSSGAQSGIKRDSIGVKEIHHSNSLNYTSLSRYIKEFDAIQGVHEVEARQKLSALSLKSRHIKDTINLGNCDMAFSDKTYVGNYSFI